MQLALDGTQQDEMRRAHLDGAPGMLVSGLVWIAAGVVCVVFAMHQAVWTLFVGGALIYPLGLLLARILGRTATTAKSNALNQLALASTVWLLLGCLMAYGLYRLNPQLFFPAMLAVIGSRYLVFATIYGLGIYWIVGLVLIAAAHLGLFLMLPPEVVAGMGGLVEVGFSIVMFSRAARRAG